MTQRSELSQTFAELANTLVDRFDLVDLLTVLSDRCVDALGATAAGVMLVGSDGVLRVVASSSDEMHVLEVLEEQAEEGPCFDTYRTGEPVLNQELAAGGERWPQFAPAATAAGFRMVQAFPLRLRGVTLGALTLFHVDTSGMDATAAAFAQAFADVATIAVLQHRVAREALLVNEQLSEALASRVVIEQAKGMVAQHEGLDMYGAFTRLRGHARNHNLRLADLAAAVVSGEISASSLDEARPESPPTEA